MVTRAGAVERFTSFVPPHAYRCSTEPWSPDDLDTCAMLALRPRSRHGDLLGVFRLEGGRFLYVCALT